jgi:hypothetical protein
MALAMRATAAPRVSATAERRTTSRRPAVVVRANLRGIGRGEGGG